MTPRRSPKYPLREDIGFGLILILGWVLGVLIVLWRHWYAGWAAAGLDTALILFLNFFVTAAWIDVRRR